MRTRSRGRFSSLNSIPGVLIQRDLLMIQRLRSFLGRSTASRRLAPLRKEQGLHSAIKAGKLVITAIEGANPEP
ncbi:hypothetical protein I7I51_00961 [Histoplasma capsulatum]|uniref:Uncharacterized protein n=1 Tax=Ajellomyces capsulatus TaxID=5037 RepID=A0A8A1MFG5_AJECA|nr:hypothetical protein I7I51_00961 [Histoplasma capsulatum]